MSGRVPIEAVPACAAPFAGRLRLGSASGTPAARLAEPQALASILGAMRAERPDADPRALGSLLVKSYAAAVIPGPLACAAGGLPLDLAPAACRLALDGAGRAEALHLPSPRSVSEEEMVRGLMGAHLAPLVAAVAAISGAAPRVLWSNVGNLVAWTLGTLLQQDEPPAQAARLYRLLLARERVSWADGRNAIHRPVTWHERSGEGPTPLVHRRRVCCLRDRAGASLCGPCPRAPRT